MENAHGVWILLDPDEWTAAAEKRWIMDGDAELNQPIRWFRNTLVSKWKSGNVLHLGRGYAFASTGNKSYGSLQN